MPGPNMYSSVASTGLNTGLQFLLHMRKTQNSGSYKMPAACSRWVRCVSRQFNPNCFIMRRWTKHHKPAVAGPTVYLTFRLPLPRPCTW